RRSGQVGRCAGPEGRTSQDRDGQRHGRDRAEPIAVRRDSEPGRRAAVQHLRLDHGTQRRVLQVQQLRHDVWLRLNTKDTKDTKNSTIVFLVRVLTGPKAGIIPGL
ncbi:MAG TPA: hypothetical protein VFV51_04690, partial [Vicinamibacterales bacterium]|nr:hypothetical protein [Vicinamibacterales bacterium]